jgi:lipopolysaccharide transport system ATP-binding protein
MLKKMGPTNEVISMYLSSKQIENLRLQDITNRNGNGCLRFTDGKISDVKAGTDWIVETFSDIKIQLHYQLMQQVNVKQARIDIGINNLLGDRVAWMSTELVAFNPNIQSGVLNFYIDHLPLSPGDYTCNLYCQINNEVADWITDVLSFSIAEKDYYNTGKNVPPKQGNILLDFRVDEIR